MPREPLSLSSRSRSNTRELSHARSGFRTSAPSRRRFYSEEPACKRVPYKSIADGSLNHRYRSITDKGDNERSSRIAGKRLESQFQCAWEILEDREIADRFVIPCQEGQDLLELLQGSHIELGVQLRRQVVHERVRVSVQKATKLAEQQQHEDQKVRLRAATDSVNQRLDWLVEITKKITERYCEATAKGEKHRREVCRLLKDLRGIWRPLHLEKSRLQELSRKCEVLPLLQRSLEDIQLCATSSAVEPPLLGQRTGRLSRTSSFGPLCSDSEVNAPQHISKQRPSAREDATPRAHKCAEHNAREDTGSPRHQVRSRSAGEEDKWQRFEERQRRRHQDDYHGSQRIGGSADEEEPRLRPRREVRRDTRNS